MHHPLALSCLAVVASAIPAQEFVDAFDIPTQPNRAPVVGWTAQSGVWAVKNGRLQTNGAIGWSYITKDGILAKDCVLDMEAFFNSNGGVQFAGLAARFTARTSTVMCKIQENVSSSGAFDRAFVYEIGGAPGSTWRDTLSLVKSAYCRMIVVGSQCWMSLDLNKDGIYDQTIGPRVLTTVSGPGQIGVNISHVSQIDNFEFFNSVLIPAPGARPRIGTTYNLQMFSPATKAVPWRMALSASNRGFQIGQRRIPIDVDPLFELSLLASAALGLGGVTNAQGDATIGFRIPNLPALVGNTLFGTVITIDAARPFAIDGITNEISIKIQ